jgi:acetyltransferase-like isoleucine patch superfamily enzyme
MLKYPIHKVRNNAYHYLTALRRFYLQKLYGMKIGENTRISGKARLDYTNPKGLHIGANTIVTFDVAILTHDFVNRKHVNTYIGDYCFIGARTTIMPGVKIGNHCIIGAGSVVTTDIPDNSLAAGVPAKVLKSGIKTIEFGILAEPDKE